MPTKRACRLMELQRSTFYRKSTAGDDRHLRRRLRELALARPRFRHRRLHVLLRREGWEINVKRVHRLYRLEGLAVPQKRKKKMVSRVRATPPKPVKPNERWAMDFVSDRLSTGRRIRLLTLIDCYTRECLAIYVDHRLPSTAVTAVVDSVVEAKGRLEVITVDNGPEFTCRHFDEWAFAHGIKVDFIRPGCPTENGYIESFNGKLRDECLSAEWLSTLADARQVVETWRRDYNEERPHSSLGNLAPAEFLASLLAPTRRVA